MQTLRSPGGCPWDREQTPTTLAPYILEEACELIDAIESEDPQLILDELGDLLLQVVFQAQIFSEQGDFNFDDVAASINSKLLRRHPHVFESDQNDDTGVDLDLQWEKIKGQEELSQKVHKSATGHLPSRLPALQYAQKLVSRATRAGLQNRLPVITLPESPVPVVEESLEEKELGEFLLQLVILAQNAGLDAEQVLRQTTRKLQSEMETLSE